MKQFIRIMIVVSIAAVATMLASEKQDKKPPASLKPVASAVSNTGTYCPYFEQQQTRLASHDINQESEIYVHCSSCMQGVMRKEAEDSDKVSCSFCGKIQPPTGE